MPVATTPERTTYESSPGHDQALCAAASNALRYSGYRVLGGLRCEVQGGVVTLSGVVAFFYLKQVAQAALARLPIIRAVNNLVTVAQA
jgi:hypothetical protein